MRRYSTKPKQSNSLVDREAKGLELLSDKEFYELYNPKKLEQISAKTDNAAKRDL